jgi:hypothetical protein
MRIISSTDVLRVPVERPHCHSCRRLINLAVVAASDEVAQLKSDGISLWDGKAALKTRYASETEKAAFFEGSSEAPFDELVLVYLVRLDASTI